MKNLLLLLLFVPNLTFAAITVDATTTGSVSNNNSLTYSHTCTGSNLTLIVGVSREGGGSAAAPTSVTYNGVSMTKIADKTSGANNNASSWYLSSPATGSNNIVITTPGVAANEYIMSGANCYAGTNANPIGATTTATGNSTTITASITTTVDNSWVIDSSYLNNQSLTDTPGGSQTKRYRVNIPAEGIAGLGSDQVTTTAGSYTTSYSLSGSSVWNEVLFELKPLAAASAPTFQLWPFSFSAAWEYAKDVLASLKPDRADMRTPLASVSSTFVPPSRNIRHR